MRWILNRETTDSDTYYERHASETDAAPANILEAKAEMMRQQVISKIHWGASDQEVYEWLQERHRITGRDADELLAQAHRAKRKAVRAKAFVMLVISGCGMLLGGGFIGMLFWAQRVVWFGTAPGFAIIIGLVSAVTFIRNLLLLLSGKQEGSVD